MKTTLEIADPLLRRAKRIASRRGVSLRALVETALERELSLEEKAPAAPVRTHVFQGNGLQPGLSWNDWAAVSSLGYEGRGG